MKGKMFGGRLKKTSSGERTPGRPYSGNGDASGKEKDNPPGYEGKEHVKYKDPGYTRHEIKFPDDEPHMKSHVGKEEMHEMEDNYHMDTPDQTPKALEAKIKRAKMKMDDPEMQKPARIKGIPVRNVSDEGELDTTGEEQMGPNYAQESGSKERRKKMVVAIAKRKMNKK